MTEQTIIKLARALGMSYCHPRYCGCGNESYLLYTRSSDAPAGEGLECRDLYVAIHLPDWANGVPPEDVYAWAQKAAWSRVFLRERMERAGMRIYRRFE